MSYVQNDLAGFRKKFKKLAKKVVKAHKIPFKKVVKLHKKVINRPIKAAVKLHKMPIKAVVKWHKAPFKFLKKVVVPRQAEPESEIRDDIQYADSKPHYIRDDIQYSDSEPQDIQYDDSEPPSYDDLEREMTQNEIDEYLTNDESGEHLNGFFSKIKQIVKKAAVVVADKYTGGMASKYMDRKKAATIAPEIIDRAGDYAVNAGIPRAVGEAAAKKSLRDYIMPIGLGVGAVVIVGGLIFMLSKKRR